MENYIFLRDPHRVRHKIGIIERNLGLFRDYLDGGASMTQTRGIRYKEMEDRL